MSKRKSTTITVFNPSKTHHSIQVRGVGTVKGLKENKHVFVDEFSTKIPFDKRNKFFLTHFHNDHLRGLKNKTFQNIVYCSHVTANILHNDPLYQHVKTKPIAFNRMKRFPFGNATLFPADHGIGSCMIFFIFKYPTKKRVLLTGDFRASTQLTKRMVTFLKRGGYFSKVDNLYIDNTFADADHWLFATYKQSTILLIAFIEEQIEIDKYDYLYLDTNAKIGYEHLWKAIASKYKEKVHVNQATFTLLKNIPGVSKHITLDPNTPFHSCGGGDTRYKYCDFLKGKKANKILNVIPSARSFKSRMGEIRGMEDWLVKYKVPHTYGLCYATHSSTQELKHFVTECGFQTKRYNFGSSRK